MATNLPPMTAPRFSNLSQVQQALMAGEVSCQSLVAHYLQRIQASRHLNAYIEVFAEEAQAKARQLDEKIQLKPDQLGRLFGMVLSIKDVICYKDHKVSAASKMLHNFTSLYSATAVQRLLAEDAIIIGRTNCDQFGMGSSNENSYYGPVRNAANPGRIPGGSSGGAAVSVQADTCLAALGTDTGGSVRQPAAFCGLVGFKPSYGRISRHGLIAYASSFDQISCLTHQITDAAWLLEVMAGADEFDSTCSRRAVEAFSTLDAFTGKARVAYLEQALEHGSLDSEIREQVYSFIGRLRAEGHIVEAASFDLLEYIIPTYYVLTTAEASSNLARYDGIRYGHRSRQAEDLHETYVMSRSEGFSDEVKRRILLGTYVLSSGYYDAYYNKAQKARRLIRQRLRALFETYDFIMMPTAPTSAWPLGEKVNDPVAMYLADIFTVPANLAGIPAISIPLGRNKDGMFIGVQLMADLFEEAALLNFAALFVKK